MHAAEDILISCNAGVLVYILKNILPLLSFFLLHLTNPQIYDTITTSSEDSTP